MRTASRNSPQARAAQDAAAAVGCSVAQIAKSIVFRAGDAVVLVIASGAHRIDRQKVSAILAHRSNPLIRHGFRNAPVCGGRRGAAWPCVSCDHGHR
jgi:prolyl-tRNA editing enzyme YbaK/EbsC (Cys-tRNA(Pro) deacylase)